MKKLYVAIAVLIIGLALAAWYGYFIYKKELSQLNPKENVAENYSKIVEKFDGNPYDLVKQGVYLSGKNQTDLALIPLKRAPEIAEGYRDAWVSLGYVYLQKSDYQNALSSLEKAVAIDPIHSQTWQLLAIVYEHLNDTTKKDEASRKAGMFGH